MKVTLLRLDGLEEAMLAASCCVSAEMPTEPNPKALLSAVRAGHLSVAEHAVATFSIEGVSRVTEIQLVRHRLASYAVQSGRYCARNPLDYEVPEACACNWDRMEDAVDSFDVALLHLDEVMKDIGIGAEDRRYFYPQGLRTNIIVTMDLREFSHACSLRRCRRAQAEIRELVDRMAVLVVREMMGQMDIRAPRDEEDHRDVVALIDLFQPQCVQRHGCPEEKGCGWYANLGEGERRWSTMPCRIPPTTPKAVPTSRRTSSGTGD